MWPSKAMSKRAMRRQQRCTGKRGQKPVTEHKNLL
jgi:hypothetical protein